MEPVDAARAVVEEHHPDARAAFLGGSVVTDRRTATARTGDTETAIART